MDKLCSCFLVLTRILYDELFTTVLVDFNRQDNRLVFDLNWLLLRVLYYVDGGLFLFNVRKIHRLVMSVSKIIVMVVMMTLTFSLFLDSLISLFFHFLKQFFVIRQSLLIDDFSDFPFDSTSDNPIDRILLALNDLLPLFCCLSWMYLWMESQLFNCFLIFDLY